jgi:hypothetical protein
MQGRDDATPTQHVNIILQDCQLKSLNNPIATKFASIYHLVYLRGSTSLIVNSNQLLQTVTRANSPIIIPDDELFIDERIIGSASYQKSGILIYELGEYTAVTDGTQNISLPIDVKGVFDINVEDEVGVCRPIYQKRYSIANNVLNISTEANIKSGDKICGSYYMSVSNDNATVPSGKSYVEDGYVMENYFKN